MCFQDLGNLGNILGQQLFLFLENLGSWKILEVLGSCRCIIHPVLTTDSGIDSKHCDCNFGYALYFNRGLSMGCGSIYLNE